MDKQSQHKTASKNNPCNPVFSIFAAISRLKAPTQSKVLCSVPTGQAGHPDLSQLTVVSETNQYHFLVAALVTPTNWTKSVCGGGKDKGESLEPDSDYERKSNSETWNFNPNHRFKTRGVFLTKFATSELSFAVSFSLAFILTHLTDQMKHSTCDLCMNVWQPL